MPDWKRVKIDFPTVKLKEHINQIKHTYAELGNLSNKTVYGVTNEKGICLTGKEASKDISKYIVLEKNCFAYNPYRINVGSLGINNNDYSGCVSPAYVVFKAENTLNPQFLFRYLKSDYGNHLINWYGNRGGVRNALRYSDLCNIDIPDLNLQEQEKFLNQIDTAYNTIDKLRTENNNQLFYLSQLRQAILQEAIEGKLTADWRKENPVRKGDPDYDAEALLEKIKAEKKKLITEGKIKRQKPLAPIKPEEVPFELPEGWVWTRLGEIIESLSTGPFGSMLHKSDYVTNGIPVVNPMNITNEGIKPDSRMMISNITASRLRRYLLKEKDIVIGRRGNLSKCALVSKNQKNWLCGTGTFFMRVKEINTDFLILQYRGKYSQTYLLQDSVGQTMDNLNQKLLKNLPIALPPLAEQNAIVEQVEKLLFMVDELEKQVIERKEQAEQLMQVVLREAFESNKEEVSHVIAKQVELPKELKITPFQQMQLIGAIIDILESYHQHQGEMIIAKYLYILAFIAHMRTGFRFKPWHFGPYDPEIKKRISNRNYFSRHGKKGFETYSVMKKETLFKYPNPLVIEARNTLPEVIEIFSKYEDVKTRDYKIELLATVLKTIEDSGKTEPEEVFYEMTKWPIDPKVTGFASKAEKFSEQEVAGCIQFVRDKGWI